MQVYVHMCIYVRTTSFEKLVSDFPVCVPYYIYKAFINWIIP